MEFIFAAIVFGISIFGCGYQQAEKDIAIKNGTYEQSEEKTFITRSGRIVTIKEEEQK